MFMSGWRNKLRYISSLPKKERQKIRKKVREEEIKRFKRARLIQKLFFWVVFSVIIVGAIYIIMVMGGY